MVRRSSASPEFSYTAPPSSTPAPTSQSCTRLCLRVRSVCVCVCVRVDLAVSEGTGPLCVVDRFFSFLTRRLQLQSSSSRRPLTLTCAVPRLSHLLIPYLFSFGSLVYFSLLVVQVSSNLFALALCFSPLPSGAALGRLLSAVIRARATPHRPY